MITGAKDKNGNAISMDDASSNCVGFSLANGGLWMDDQNTIETVLSEFTTIGTGEKSFEQIGYMNDMVVAIDYTSETAGKTMNFAHMSRVGTNVNGGGSLNYPQKDSYHGRNTGKVIEDVLNFRGDAAANNYTPSMLVYYQANNKVVSRPNGNTTIKPGLSVFHK